MIYGSVCSGIEAASVAWAPLGWRAAFYAEIDPFPSAVLAHRHPGIANFGDFTRIEPSQHEPIELLVGGTPCQSFSIAGLRGGLADGRGNLALEFLRLAQRARPRWLVWENVPGVLSSNEGRDFGAILGGLVELGYGFAYRVLDAQYVRVDGFRRAVPQRRRRVFVVGHLGDWRRAAAVLFERASLSGNSPPRRQAGEGTAHDVAPCLGASGRGFERPGDPRGQDCIIASTGEISHCLNAGGMGRLDYETETMVAHALRADGFDASEDGTGRGTPLVPAVAFRTSPNCGAWETGDRTDALTTGSDPSSHLVTHPYTLAIRGRGEDHNLEYRQDGTANAILTPNGGRGGVGVGAVAYGLRSDAARDGTAHTPSPDAEGRVRLRDPGFNVYEELAPTVDAGAAHLVGHALEGWAVRRLTPRECERLQGFPDDYTLIPWRGKTAPDGPRYKALGNSMAVNVMRWIGTRIAMVDRIEFRRAA